MTSKTNKQTKETWLVFVSCKGTKQQQHNEKRGVSPQIRNRGNKKRREGELERPRMMKRKKKNRAQPIQRSARKETKEPKKIESASQGTAGHRRGGLTLLSLHSL